MHTKKPWTINIRSVTIIKTRQQSRVSVRTAARHLGHTCELAPTTCTSQPSRVNVVYTDLTVYVGAPFQPGFTPRWQFCRLCPVANLVSEWTPCIFAARYCHVQRLTPCTAAMNIYVMCIIARHTLYRPIVCWMLTTACCLFL